ncbi:putative methyltransferase-domain-containing protein [Baffinella frigidus]|nr:putative methyltransferase-domain-containing protein [Cryptophyta sp. CCMP2293]
MNDELRALREARVARQAANPTHSEVVLGEGESLTRVKLVEVHGQALGSSLWESGTLLAEFLVSPEGRALVEGKDRAMELGCGVGLPGLALALLLGRREVVLTDNTREALALAEQSILANTLGDRVSAAELCWEEPEQARAQFGEFDLVVAADVLYRQDLLAPLLATLLALTHPGSLVLIGYKQRIASDRSFFLAARRAFEIDVVSSNTSESRDASGGSRTRHGSGPGHDSGHGVTPDTDEGKGAAGEDGEGGNGSNDVDGSNGFNGSSGAEWVSGARPVVFRMVRRSEDLPS